MTELLLENLEWARGVAVHYMKEKSIFTDKDEFMADAIVGLWKACLKFDKDRGVTFRNFAGKLVRWEITDGARRRDRLTRTARRRVGAGETSWRGQDGNLIFAPVFTHLEGSAGNDFDGSKMKLADVLDDQSLPVLDQVIFAETNHELYEALAALSEKERMVLARIFIEEMTGVALAEELGTTEARVSQIKSDALKHTRDFLKERKAA